MAELRACNALLIFACTVNGYFKKRRLTTKNIPGYAKFVFEI
jgi:hypothetical protein